MNHKQIKEAWNAQADEHNQWASLGEDEKIEFALQIGALDAKRLDWLAIHGSFGVDSVTGLPGGNGQKRIAATRQAIDAAMQGGQKGSSDDKK